MRAALLLLALSAAAAAQTVPPLTGRVVDTADILSPATERALTERLAAFEDSTTVQVAVLTIPSLGGSDLEALSTAIFRAWGLGQAATNNGVLLLVARDDRKLRIEVGYGLEGDLTDARAAAIIRDEIVPRFRTGDFDAGVLAGVEAILGTVEGTYSASGGTLQGIFESPERTFALFFGGIPFLILVLLLLGGTTGPNGDSALGWIGGFLGIYMTIALFIWTRNPWSLLGLVGFPLGAIVLNHLLDVLPFIGPARRARQRRAEIFGAARRRGQTSVVIDGVSHRVPALSSSSSGGSSSSSSSFSGGGGSSGGGGASGSW